MARIHYKKNPKKNRLRGKITADKTKTRYVERVRISSNKIKNFRISKNSAKQI